MWSAIDHPTIRRDQTSVTAAQWDLALGGEVFGDVGAPQLVRADGARWSPTPPVDGLLDDGGRRR